MRRDKEEDQKATSKICSYRMRDKSDGKEKEGNMHTFTCIEGTSYYRIFKRELAYHYVV